MMPPTAIARHDTMLDPQRMPHLVDFQFTVRDGEIFHVGGSVGEMGQNYLLACAIYTEIPFVLVAFV